MAKRAGWITSPFIIIPISMGFTFAYGGILFNLIIYLFQYFNVNEITAAQIFNMFNGCVQIFPLYGAFLAESYLGCYSVIWISSIILSLGCFLLVLTASLANLCECPSGLQLGVQCIGLALIAIGVRVKRYKIGPMGANQFHRQKHHNISFNSFFFTVYMFFVISSFVIGNIGGKLGWAWGFAVSGAVNVLGLAIYLSGTRFYLLVKPQGRPFVGLARVVVAAIRKAKRFSSEKIEDYCQDPRDKAITIPSNFLRFLNRASMKMEGETKADGSIRQPWRLCTVKEVEDFKTVIRLLPLWSSAILVNVPIILQYSAILLQALTMDRQLGSSNFEIPASAMNIFVFIGTCSTIFLMNRFILPLWEMINGRPMTLLQRVGIGHLVDIICMVVSALVEIKRLKMVKLHNLQGQDSSLPVPMSVFWLVPGLVLSGVGEGFHIPGNFAFSYQEFPAALKSTSNGIVGLAIGIAFYVGVAVIDVVKKATNWMPDNINKGRLDNVFWLVGILGGINFCYFLVCAYFYEYQNVEEKVKNGADRKNIRKLLASKYWKLTPNSKDSKVKLKIKSFRVPEFFIEIPETATVGSLKKTVMEAVTAILSDGLRLQGKKIIRDDNKTLLQTGICHDNKLDALGFSLESLHTEIRGTCDALPDPPGGNLNNLIESDHDSAAPSPPDMLMEKNAVDAGALVSILAMNSSEAAQRRIRRLPFSVSEVEDLVQAVEKLGTGRWRDVKLRAFDNAEHRTYVDLKNKWKTLVHTARISPQQRRGEPVPEKLLDRVLNALAYWSQHR